MKETKEVLVYSCGYCGKLYYEKSQADFCHTDRTCGECGVVIGKLDYYTNCKSCRDKKELVKQQEIIDKATRMTYDEYMKIHPNYPVVYGEDYMFDDYDYLLDKIEDNEDKNPIIWGAKKQTVNLESYQIIERYEEDVELDDYEMDVTAQGEIHDFCVKWNEKYAQDVYYEDNSILIVLED